MDNRLKSKDTDISKSIMKYVWLFTCSTLCASWPNAKYQYHIYQTSLLWQQRNKKSHNDRYGTSDDGGGGTADDYSDDDNDDVEEMMISVEIKSAACSSSDKLKFQTSSKL